MRKFKVTVLFRKADDEITVDHFIGIVHGTHTREGFESPLVAIGGSVEDVLSHLREQLGRFLYRDIEPLVTVFSGTISIEDK